MPTEKEIIKLNKEYYKLSAELKIVNSRSIIVQKRMAEIRRTTDIRENIVDERPDEITLKH